MDFDALIIGGGAAGMSCALILGSALPKSFAKDKSVGILMHQKTSDLQSALFYNAFGIKPGTEGKEILLSGKKQLSEEYPEVEQIEGEKVQEIEFLKDGFRVTTNKTAYISKKVIVAVGYGSPLRIKGLEDYVIPHQKTKPSKNRIELKNIDHLVAPGLYVAGSLAGWRSQFAIASGSGASVATDILTDWNQGEHTKVHDKLK